MTAAAAISLSVATATAAFALPAAVAATFLLTAAVVSSGPALTLGATFRRVDKRGRKHNSRGDDE